MNERGKKKMNNKVNFRKVFNELDKEELYKFIDTEVRKEYLYNCESLQMNGWTNRFMLTSEGKYYLTNPISSGDMSMSEYNGEEIRLFEIPCYIEYDYRLSVDDIEGRLTDDQVRKLYDVVCTELKLDIEDKAEYKDIESLIDDYVYYSTVEENFISMYRHEYDDFLRDCFNYEFTYSILENYDTDIENALSMSEE